MYFNFKTYDISPINNFFINNNSLLGSSYLYVNLIYIGDNLLAKKDLFNN